MATLSTENRRRLEQTIVNARGQAERAAKAALEALAVGRAKPDAHMSDEQKAVRNHLRARARQLGDKRATNDTHEIDHLARECAYEHWHRMLFARFLAENNLLIEPDTGVAISLDECRELAKEENTDLWTLAGRYAQRMLPQIFRADDPILSARLAREDELKLEGFVDRLPTDVFTATDSLGWCYQFWQNERKDEINKSGDKIGADELPAVTQLFTEDYMVDFLLDNTLGAWWAGRQLAADNGLLAAAKSEEDCLQKVALPGCEWKYLRFLKDEKGAWRPAAGTFDGWPKVAKDLKCMDPCCGSGHFLVAMFERLVALRSAEEGLGRREASDVVLRENVYGVEIDSRCTQIAAFNLALCAWKYAGYAVLPTVNVACSGLEIGGTEADWVALAPDQGFEMERLFALFRNASALGSLINPATQTAFELSGLTFGTLRSRIAEGIEKFRKDSDYEREELGVTAQGLTGALSSLGAEYVLVATNVPYLTRGKQCSALQQFCDHHYPDAKTNLATTMLERCREMTRPGGTIALVTVQTWLFQVSYRPLRKTVLQECALTCVARLGMRAFQTQMWDFPTCLFIASGEAPVEKHRFSCVDCETRSDAGEIALDLRTGLVRLVSQGSQRANADHVITCVDQVAAVLVGAFGRSIQGIKTGDDGRVRRKYWEVPRVNDDWRFFQSTIAGSCDFGGLEHILWWGDDGTGLARKQGLAAWGKRGVAISQMSQMPCAFYLGEPFDSNMTAFVPGKSEHLGALYAFFSSEEFCPALRKIDQAIKPTNSSYARVEFDYERWERVGRELFPDGFPLPHSKGPTQWLFDGLLKGAEQPLQVAVARMLGYMWPRQTGSEFPDCPPVKADGLERLADEDGIVCIPSVRGEPSAPDRLLTLLTAASVKPDRNLDDWLRNSFFEEHCKLFHDRPFIWHIWDGRRRDGFHALVNYHKLADGVKGRRLLEKLTHAYLGDWITRQRSDVKDEKEGAEERLAAALALKKRLEAIIEGEPPFDIFVRWKPLARQSIGWAPDINDGVRMNIRPFMVSDLPGGKKGAGVLRAKPNIKWRKDRGKEPRRPKEEYPWFWSWDEETENFAGGVEFDGNRWNDCHYTNDVKQRARK